MPRPQKCRKICSKPEFTAFSPEGGKGEQKADPIVLTFDEFEVIRLVDMEKQTHEKCAKQMEISRTTVTEIYESAREKIAASLVNGQPLFISGGNYRLCDGASAWCCKQHCDKQEQQIILKGDNIMRIAVTYENGEVFQHFGHSEQFKIYDIEDNKIVSVAVADTNGSGHGALAGFLKEHEADVLICGGIGGGAQTALAAAGIKLYGGVSGSADEAVKALLLGTLGYNPNVCCNHHGHGHSCGDHSCGR